jgi:hypothetical protein
MISNWTNHTNLQPRILIIGLPWVEEFIKISESTKTFSTLKLHEYNQVISQGWSELIKYAEECDYLILRGDAYKLILQLNSLNLLQRFNRLCCSKIFWSLDSHVLYKLEPQVFQYFDYFCVAHSEWIDYFASQTKALHTKLLHIPCSFSLVPTKVLRTSLFQQKNNLDFDVFFPYIIYKSASRNILSFEVFQVLQKMNLKIAFGEVTGYSNTLPEKSLLFNCLKRSKVVLNLSMAGELNKKPFEAYYARSKIVSNYSLDLTQFPDVSRGAILFNQNNSSAESIAELVRDAVSDYLYPEVDNSIVHTDLNRILQIVENVSGISLLGSVEEYVVDVECEILNSKLTQKIYIENDLAIQWFRAMSKHHFFKFIFTKSPFFNSQSKLSLIGDLPKDKFFEIRHQFALRYQKVRRNIFKCFVQTELY